MKKKVSKTTSIKKSNKINLSSSALTLAISGIFLTFFASPIIAPLFFVVALVFSIVQQTKNPDRLGKIALIVSIVGIVVFTIWMILLFKVFLPALEQAVQQGAI